MKNIRNSALWSPFSVAVILIATTLVYAEEVFQPGSSDIFVTTTDDGKFTCARPSATDSWMAGYWKASTNIFTSAKEMMKKKKAQIKAATDPAKKLKLQKSFAKTRTYMKNGTFVCSFGPGGSPPSKGTPTATPAPGNPTRTPAPTPTTSPSNCSDSGGDITRGRNFFILNCQGCHPVPSELRGTNCSKLLSSYNRSEMRGIPHTAQNDTDIVAYLKSL